MKPHLPARFLTRAPDLFGVTPLGGDGFQLVAARMHNGTITEVTCAEFGSASEAEAACKKLGYRKGSKLVAALPRHEVIVKYLTLPTADPGQVARMVPHEARALAPWPEDEGVYGHSLIPSDETERSTILLFLARLETVETQLARLHEWGLYPTRVELSSVSLSRLLSNAGASALLYSDRHGMEYVYCTNGSLLFSRGASRSNDAGEFFRESRNLERRKTASDGSDRAVYVAGDTDLNAALRDDLNTESLRGPGELSCPILNGVSLAPDSPILGIGAAIGGAVGAETENLLPRAEKDRLVRNHLLRQAATLIAVLGLVTVASLLLYRYYYVSELTYAERLREEVQALRSEGGDLAARADQIAFLQSQYISASVPLEVVLDLYETTPMDVGLNYFRYTDNGTVVIGGEAPTFDTVQRYLEALSASELVEDVNLVYSSRPVANTDQVVEFRLTLGIATG